MQEQLKSETGQIGWRWDGKNTDVGYDRLGSGPLVVLLPAPSSISTRREMRPLQERLASDFSTIAIDWPGFGEGPRPSVNWSPETYAAFLRFVLTELAPSPAAIVAAGHGASYALASADAAPQSALCLVAPTWRGPLPTVVGEHRPWMRGIVRAGDLPVIGSLLYRLNVNRPMMRMMAKGHVYQDAEWLSPDRLSEKLVVVKARGARHASLRFVTGQLDLFLHRQSFLDAATRATAPVLVVYGSATPRRSKAEMETLAALPGVQAVELPSGKLAVHEEFPDAVADAVRAFLNASATPSTR